ncbi:hypothetical protein HPB52_009418 [Rhipicephalus sanguineus]|uniref:Uncharacterized protein n=1 Tax=Rhipicephalus sanguineus TaxID=34632 RepID=A0A9D4SSA8_RHISA|nr:hypothetical protein HPB52_009418 [Rhipicephalus sanguineus]
MVDREETNHCRPACTAYKDHLCQISKWLPNCNEVLLDIGMELREQRRDSLSLVSFQPYEADVVPPPGPALNRATTFFRWLLRTHVCITGIELIYKWVNVHTQAVLEELPENSRLKKLKVYFSCQATMDTRITTLLPRLHCLEELDCYMSNPTDALVTAVSSLLRNTTCLTSLEFHGVFENGQPPKTFIDALAANSTLKSFELWANWNTNEPPGCLGEYVRNNRLLTKLTLFGEQTDREGLFLDEALYIRATTVLRELRLCVTEPANAASTSWWALVLESISANTSIGYISISSGDNLVCNGRLAITVGLSRYITRVFYIQSRREWDPATFIIPLSDAIRDNYNLLQVDLCNAKVGAEATRCLFTIRETIRRNTCLLERAAAFNQTTALDRDTAAALEKVSRRPALVRELAEKEGIAPCEVARMVRSRLRSVDGLHDYMRLTGVVKECVACAPPVEVGSTQLHDLNTDCWRALRRYLSFDDVTCFTVDRPDKLTPS